VQIVSWNVNSLRARCEHVTSFLKTYAPDVLLLQETKVIDALFPREVFEDLGYNVAVFGQKSYNGVAILSKRPLEEITYGLSCVAPKETPVRYESVCLKGQGEEAISSLRSVDTVFSEARYIQAFTKGIWVASVYVPNGDSVGHEKYVAKLAFLKALKAHVQTQLLCEDVFVLGGDFNVAPSARDVYDPKIWNDAHILTSTLERQAYRELLHQKLIDPVAFERPVSDHTSFTWWDYRTRGFENERGLRIDHLLVSPEAYDLYEKTVVYSEERAKERPSDHAPVAVFLNSSLQ